MNSAPAIPRASLTWLLAAQALVLVPLWFEVPSWLILLWLACSLWRIQMLRMRASRPGIWIKAGLVVLTAGGIYLSIGNLIALDAAASLLVATFVLKLLEMHSARDAWVLVLLGFFSLVVGYLFDASLAWALYSLLPIMALLAALVSLQPPAPVVRPMAGLKWALVMTAQALPLAILLFVFFPRMAPLWSLPMPSNQATTGLSDNIAPGDIADLARSPALAFRVSFEGPLPARNQLYWRAMTLDRFDGRRWSQADPLALRAAPRWEARGPQWQYRIIQQATGKPWLFALDTGRVTLPDVRQASDFRLQRRAPVDQTLLYSVSSWPQALRQPELPDFERRQALQLPRGGDPKARQLGQDLRTQYPEPSALVNALLERFSRQDYYYTLRPQVLGSDSVDDFLFKVRRGFCAHYAGAMVFVLRAAGVPARIVSGYLGGEFNPAGNYLTLRQYDAHAWVEYWQAGQGWRTADPTAAVAPQRVEAGLAQALADDEGFLEDEPFSALRYRNLGWLNELRLGWESLNYSWQRWVLGYQEDEQQALFRDWLKGYGPWLFLGGVVLLVGLAALLLLKPWRHRPGPQIRQFAAFEKLLARRGVIPEPGEGPHDFAARAAARLPEHAVLISAFIAAYSAQRYGGETSPGTEVAEHLTTLRRALARRPHS